MNLLQWKIDIKLSHTYADTQSYADACRADSEVWNQSSGVTSYSKSKSKKILFIVGTL